VFTQIEALALVMAVHDDPDELVGSAIEKVVKALPESVARQAAALREHASAAPDWHAARPDPATTSALVDAVACRRRVVIGYRSDAGKEFSTEVEPWAVVVRHRRWYLLCRSPRSSSIRTYRIDRVGSVEQTPHAFQPPGDLDPVAALEENLGTGWGFPTHVVFDAPLARVAPWVHAPMGRLSAAGSGCELIGSTSNPEMYAQEWLARVPFDFRVRGGPELAAAVAAVAARFARAV
jgi:predicted DNA-binding transcriptional regulator YafY